LGCLKFMWTDTTQNYDAENLTERNIDISQILNPIEVFFTDMESYQDFYTTHI
jgi:hypothetical protein